MSPVRVRLERTKGWRMPENTVKVDRRGPWGNPFPIGFEGPAKKIAGDAETAVAFFCQMLDDPELRAVAGYPTDLSPLRGKNLACWCSGKWCHADVLLKRANEC